MIPADQDEAVNRDKAEKVSYATIKMFLIDTLEEGRDDDLEKAFRMVRDEFLQQTAGMNL